MKDVIGMDLNATYLFEKPLRSFHSAEPWWSAYFTMLALWGEAEGQPMKLPIYTSTSDGHLVPNGEVSFAGANYRNTVADARLNGEPFSITEWPNKYLHLRPDVTFIKNAEKRHVTFVETKTIGASVKANLGIYSDLATYLREHLWSVEMYYLLSIGHEEEKDWPLLANAKTSIITWEDVFRSAEGTPFGRIFGDSLLKYCR